MFPGLTTKLSESTVASTTSIDVTTDLILLTGTTDVATIVPHFGGGFSGILFVVPVDDDVATTTAGNIALAVTMPQSQVTVFVFSKSTATWYPGAIS